MYKRQALHSRRLILAPGNYGLDYLAQNYPELHEIPIVKVSNFVGEALDMAAAEHFAEVLLVGHIDVYKRQVKQSLGSDKPLHVLPGCALGGASFCLLCDLIARSLFAPTELSISSVTAVFGAPVVIWLLVRHHSGEGTT